MEQLVKLLPLSSDLPLYLTIDIGIAVLLSLTIVLSAVVGRHVGLGFDIAASAVACAIITKSIIEWTEGSDVQAFIAVFSGTILVLLVLLAATGLPPSYRP